MKILILLLLLVTTGFAEPLRIGIHEKPPFAMRTVDGGWEGLAVDLWKAVAAKSGLEYTFHEVPYENLVTGLQSGELDAVVGELSITPLLESRIDFSQPYLTTSLGAVVSSSRWQTDWLLVLRDFFSWDLAKILGFIVLGLITAGLVIWFLERNHPSGHFGGGFLEGFGSGLWFAATTMTSVGYGDKTPNTLLGRLVAFLWMLAGVLILAGFIGGVASSMSEARVKATILGASDILKLRNGSLEGSSVQMVLRQEGVRCQGFESAAVGIQAVASNEIDCFLGDHLTLSYILQHQNPRGVRLLTLSMYQFSLAIAFPQGSALREKTAVPLLEVLATPEWSGRLRYWLGADASLGYQMRALGQ